MPTTQFNDIYRGKKVLITGHTGFKGSWLSLWLTKLGAEVIGYSKDIPTTPSHFELLGLPLTTVTDDILHKEKLLETLRVHKPDIVFHLAAQPIVRDSYRQPVETFETNIMGTANVLESCRLAGSVKAIVAITSDKCYRNNEWERGYKEDDAMGGHDPYSASKGAADIVANAFRSSFFNPEHFGQKHSTLLAVARAGNVIGGGDWARERLIPDIARATGAGQTVVIRSPLATRPWQHVLEPLSGYLQLGWKLLEGKKDMADNWNFGPTDSSNLTVQQVIDFSHTYWAQVRHDVQEDASNFHEAKFLTLDSTKAHDQLHWNSVWDGETTCKKTIEWYKKYYTQQIITSEQDLQSYIADAQRAHREWVTA